MLHAATLADAALRHALELEGDDPLQEGWVDRITPLAIGEIPAYLLESLPDFTDTRLDDVSLSPILRPLVTDWYPLPPEQPSAPSGSPLCPKDAFELLLPAGAARLRAWFDHQLRDPTLENVMRDMAVLGRAASRWQTALYCSNGDIKDYFNHLAVATSELSKVGILLDRGPCRRIRPALTEREKELELGLPVSARLKVVAGRSRPGRQTAWRRRSTARS